MTRYHVPVSRELLAARPSWLPVEGFRLVSVDGKWHRNPEMAICTFEDDNAPPELEGKLVEPMLQQHLDGTVTVAGRTEIMP